MASTPAGRAKQDFVNLGSRQAFAVSPFIRAVSAAVDRTPVLWLVSDIKRSKIFMG